MVCEVTISPSLWSLVPSRWRHLLCHWKVHSNPNSLNQAPEI